MKPIVWTRAEEFGRPVLRGDLSVYLAELTPENMTMLRNVTPEWRDVFRTQQFGGTFHMPDFGDVAYSDYSKAESEMRYAQLGNRIVDWLLDGER